MASKRCSQQKNLQWFLGILFTLALFPTLLLANLFLLTSWETASRVIISIEREMFELDKLWNSNYPLLLETIRKGAEPIRLPGFPVELELSSQDVISKPEDELKRQTFELLAQTVYFQGFPAVGNLGNPSKDEVLLEREDSLPTFLSLLSRAVNFFTYETHRSLRLLLLFSSGLTLILIFPYVLSYQRFGKLVSLGASLSAAALTSLVVVFLVQKTATGLIGNARDPFVMAMLAIIEALAQALQRNYLILSLLGLAILLLGLGANRLVTAPKTAIKRSKPRPSG